MKKVLKSFTFWAVVAGLLVVWQHQLGGDAISVYWYIGAVFTFALYGAAIDGIRFGIKKMRKSEQ